MLDDEICRLRNKLNKVIEDNEDYEVIYNVSIALDELIVKHYKLQKERLTNK